MKLIGDAACWHRCPFGCVSSTHVAAQYASLHNTRRCTVRVVAQFKAVQSVIEATHSVDCVQLAAAFIPRGARQSDLDWLSARYASRPAPCALRPAARRPARARPAERDRATAPRGRRADCSEMLLALVLSQCAPRTCEGGSKLPQSKVCCASFNVMRQP